MYNKIDWDPPLISGNKLQTKTGLNSQFLLEFQLVFSVQSSDAILKYFWYIGPGDLNRVRFSCSVPIACCEILSTTLLYSKWSSCNFFFMHPLFYILIQFIFFIAQCICFGSEMVYMLSGMVDFEFNPWLGWYNEFKDYKITFCCFC